MADKVRQREGTAQDLLAQLLLVVAAQVEFETKI
jgi:hypothetical protein